MTPRNLLLFYGNNLSTQILASRLSSKLSEMGHRVFFIHSQRSTKAAYSEENLWPEIYYPVILLEKAIFPFLDSQPLIQDAKAWSPDHLAQKFGTTSLSATQMQLNTPETLDFIRANNIQGGISVRFPFLFKQPILSYFSEQGSEKRPRFFWNLHSGILPDYAGYAPFRWVMYNEEPLASFTLHELSAAIDSGPIIDLRPQAIDYSLDMISAFLNLIPSAVTMTTEAVEKVMNGKNLPTIPNNTSGSGKYYPRLTPQDRDRMSAKGLQFVDLERLKETYLHHFSIPGTTHHSAFRILLDKLFASPSQPLPHHLP